MTREQTAKIATIGIAFNLLEAGSCETGFARADERNKPAAKSNKVQQPVNEYTRINTRTGLPVRVRSYFRRVVEPKAVGVRSHIRKGHLVRGYERKPPTRGK